MSETVNEVIQNALTPIVPIVTPEIYKGESAEYIFYTMTEIPTGFGDDEPHEMRYLIMLHWYSPYGSNPTAKKKQICRALRDAGMIYPTVTDISDELGRILAFETEAMDGDV